MSSGISKKEVLEKRISPLLESYMEKRSSFVFDGGKEKIELCDGIEREVSVMFPIIGAGDVMGAVVLLSEENVKEPTQTVVKLAQVAAGFLGKQMEE